MTDPNFFIVGAPKCGTTALASYLSEHPDVNISKPKEPHYFLHRSADNRKITEYDHYIRLFSSKSNTTASGEASVWYLYSSTARRAIAREFPESKIIIMRRDPVDFFLSMHSEAVFCGSELEVDPERAWRRECERYVAHSVYDPIELISGWRNRYIELMQHDKYIREYQKTFGKEKVLVLTQEEMAEDVGEVYCRTLVHLGVSSDFRPDFKRVNQNKEARSAFVQKVLRGLTRNERLVKVSRAIKKRLGVGTFGVAEKVRRLNARTVSRPQVSEQFRDEVRRMLCRLDQNDEGR
ncbi:sulfotransferase [Thioalkalivibrio sp. AKL12]|uniref:sulfotransferase family protein n=1 Tax=Thioalkalivibrio sp. AKL12 TaxID=1158159 RepID=UPI0018C957DC|nr:sulfotransferase [Thioalkalivibrio sp. AKL12]